MSSNSRVAKNTIYLYIRTFLVMLVTLYTSRVVLKVLGVDDYGIYTVVGGVVSLLTFLNSAMVQATQRYLNFASGKDNYYYQVRVFSTSIAIHLAIALIVFFILETLGLWYVNNIVVLPPERLHAANWVFQFAILVFLTKIVSVPYISSVVANEHMHIYAYVSIIDAGLQLGSVFLLKAFDYDKLILYGLFQALIAVFNLFFYFGYCRAKYKECVFKRISDWSLFKEMFSFASWAFLGGLGFVASGQGVNLVLNLFCGPAVNTARAVSYQVSSAMQTFVSSFQQALNPQITKRYARGNTSSMLSLVKSGSKYTFLVLLVCCIPVLLRPDFVLGLWLGQVPLYADKFLVLALIMSLITSMGGSLNTAMQATGNIKLFQIVVSIIMCFDVPLAYLLLTFSVKPYFVTLISVGTSLLCLIAKVFILRKEVQYSIRDYILTIILKNCLVGVIDILLIAGIGFLLPNTLWGFVLLCVLSVLISLPIFAFLALNRFERKMIIDKIEQYIILKTSRHTNK